MVIDFSLIVACVMTLVEIGKTFKLPTRWCPILAILLGIGLNLVLETMGITWQEQSFYGILIGLTAAGVFDVVKLPIVATKDLVVKTLGKRLG